MKQVVVRTWSLAVGAVTFASAASPAALIALPIKAVSMLVAFGLV
ncbi:MAG: hypothetical protein ABJ034_00770 [Hyphomicrobiales bacterium]